VVITDANGSTGDVKLWASSDYPTSAALSIKKLFVNMLLRWKHRFDRPYTSRWNNLCLCMDSEFRWINSSRTSNNQDLSGLVAGTYDVVYGCQCGSTGDVKLSEQ
jgi:hypothetical protein